jgi:hypothetical protein
MISLLLSGNERVQILSAELDKDIKYVQTSVDNENNKYLKIGISHKLGYGLPDLPGGITVKSAFHIFLEDP